MDEQVRQLVRERAGDRCEYCRLPQAALPWARFHVDHIRAQQHRGTDDPSNLALACNRCNAHKGPNLSTHDPISDDLVPLFNPRNNEWDEHFVLDANEIHGLTDIGRATVALLSMNDPDRVQLRSLL